MKKTINSPVDRVYKLNKEAAPLSYMLSSRHTKRSPLLYFNEEEGVNKPLRYAKNQKTPFEDEQDGNAILEPIVFQDGMLRVPKNNPVLQYFLELHPGYNNVFSLVDDEKDAAKEVDILNYELEAQLLARDMKLEKLESVARVLVGTKIDKMTTAEIKRDVLVYARNNPSEFLNVINDPMLELQDKVVRMFSSNLLILQNKGKDVHFNLAKNKTKMLTVPFGENAQYIVASYFQSDEGIESFRLLEKKMKN